MDSSPSTSDSLDRTDRPTVIGVVGGVASGKSTVARLLEQWGAHRIDADRMAKEALERDDVRHALLKRFGADILDSDGRVIRAELARHVFDAPDASANRTFLEELTHPIVRAAILEEIKRLEKRSVPAVVLDVPLLLEVGWGELCDEIVFVDAPDELRRRRAEERGWDESTWRRREAAQWPVATKRAQATAVIDNGSDRESLEKQLRQWWASRD